VVRRRIGHRDGRPLLTDALGELSAITDTDLTVVTRTGPVTIRHADVVAAKRVPARTVTRREIVALEAAANEAWPAPVQEALGRWILRAAAGWSARANSALAVGDPGLPAAAAIGEVERWYDARGLEPAVTTPLPVAARVAAMLAERGWLGGTPVLVQTASLATVRQALPGHGGSGHLSLTAEPTDEWLALTTPPGSGPAPPAALLVLTTAGRAPARFAHLHDASGRLVAGGRGTITGNGRWLGLSRMAVATPARRQVLARRVVAALAEWAGQAPATTDAFLQVEDDNAAAISLYAGLGFSTHHSYVTWRQPRTARRGLVERACA
jgi:N-acetylglutamate synthase